MFLIFRVSQPSTLYHNFAQLQAVASDQHELAVDSDRQILNTTPSVYNTIPSIYKPYTRLWLS